MTVSPDPVPAVAAAPARSSYAIGNALGVASMVTWAAGFPAAELLLDSWPPLALIAVRFTLAIALLLPVWLILEGPRRVFGARWGYGSLLGGLGFGTAATLLLVAQSLTDPVTVALIASMTPVCAALIEIVNKQRRMTRNLALGLLASVIGGAIATSQVAPTQLGLGALCAVAACFLFSWGSFATVRDLPNLSPLGRTSVTLAGGALTAGLFVGVAHAIGWTVLPTRPVDGLQMSYLLIYALAGMALSQLMWIASVGRLGVAIASLHINIAPFYVMLMMLALGADWSWTKAFGAAIVALGLVIAQKDRA